ncbi:DUF805 domain-containing protein [Kineococcus rhizosphaerae]|uniref:Uncharacterized membrane protein YhaH (DUF805 family) n=1 Tax=Kineococcus rhizosphaerae TaxID=559628 RepID=A0A2T0RA90_9ACTN|nr:DUF805 domain-containing protein [Kineococcus rhizosphaerae]PRY18082.1 uncharacterized membrane protein YhaH (DUF805 family) [Kineococcus rhizosphaerae]
MGFVDAVKTCLRQYATFTGRARRSEYWYFYLFQTLLGLVLGVALVIALVAVGGAASATGSDTVGAGGSIALVLLYLLVGAVSLALLLPSLAVHVRRLHDTGRSGWWILISLVPLGGIVLLVFNVMDSVPGPNQHGPNPKGVGDAYGQFPGQPNQFGGQPGQYGQPGRF